MANGGRETTHYASKSAHRARDDRLGALAHRQRSLVTLAQLTGLGFSPSGVRGRVARGKLHRVRSGIFAVHPPPYDKTQHRLAAVLACGPGAALCGLTAADQLGIAVPDRDTIHVRSPRRTGRGRRGITVHRGSVDPRDLRIVDSVPCVSADVVLLDIAADLDEAELEVVLVAAQSKGLLKRGRLAELIAERAGLPGIHRLAAITALEPAVARSELELHMLPIARMAGLARPRVNHAIQVPGRSRPLTVDFAWPELRMVVEADSQRFHGDWQRAAADRERDQLLALAGWRCHRFTRDRLIHERQDSAQRLRELAAVRARELERAG
ncbi:MAG TPA: type IV toxin-antitoxin system AbiEi family antitoxin domain-containing protein [Solirubrobacterales bacterium]|nr:type IV toxin-antitoxin system AbiEi family antitoxin domain-containing protein [Solirubrobacterales bacterium]